MPIPSCCALAVLLIAQDVPREVKLGLYQGKTIEYVEFDGMAIVEGDIILGPVSLVQPASDVDGKKPAAAVFRPNPGALWPRGRSGVAEIPYTVSGLGLRLDVLAAVRKFNETFQSVIQFVERGSQHRDFVNIKIDFEFGGCTGVSAIGRQGGEQPLAVTGSDCVNVLLHEMGHAAGLLHEHTRKDRAKHILVNWRNIALADRGQYRPVLQGGEDLGAFDYGSIMIYNNNAPSLDARESTLETIPPGIRILPRDGEFSAADIAGMRLHYGSGANPQIIAVSNPPGIPLTVERGATDTVLDVPRRGGLSVYRHSDGNWYRFARWSDVVDIDPANPPDARRIVANGNQPQVFIANFVRLQRLENNRAFRQTNVRPPGAGTIAVSHPLTTIDNVGYRISEVPVTATAVPVPGYSFYGWKNPSGNDQGVNPRRINPDAVTRPEAQFARNLSARIETDPPGLAVTVDGVTYRGAKNFAAPEGDLSFDGPGWRMGSSHRIQVGAQQPTQVETPDAVLRFRGWSTTGGNDPSFDVRSRETAFVANGQTIVARYTHAYPLELLENGRNGDKPCAIGSVAIDPPAENGRYDEGSRVKITVRPNPGWQFVDWDPPVPSNEFTVRAGFQPRAILNTTSRQLAVTRIDPPRLRVGMSSFSVIGNGFDKSTRACLYANESLLGCDSPTETSSTELRFAIPTISPTYVAQARTLEFDLRNNDGKGCEVVTERVNLPLPLP